MLDRTASKKNKNRRGDEGCAQGFHHVADEDSCRDAAKFLKKPFEPWTTNRPDFKTKSWWTKKNKSWTTWAAKDLSAYLRDIVRPMLF